MFKNRAENIFKCHKCFFKTFFFIIKPLETVKPVSLSCFLYQNILFYADFYCFFLISETDDFKYYEYK